MGLAEDVVAPVDKTIAELEADLARFRRAYSGFYAETVKLERAWQSPYSDWFRATDCELALGWFASGIRTFRSKIDALRAERDALHARVNGLLDAERRVRAWYAARPDPGPSHPERRPRWVGWAYTPYQYGPQRWPRADPRWEAAQQYMRARGCVL